MAYEGLTRKIERLSKIQFERLGPPLALISIGILLFSLTISIRLLFTPILVPSSNGKEASSLGRILWQFRINKVPD